MHIRLIQRGLSSLTLILLVATLAGTGCAGSGGNKSDLPERIEQDGYSFMSPAEPQWFIAERSRSRITLAKVGRVDGETFLIEGTHLSLDTLSDPSELTRFVEDLQKRDLPAPRFRIRQHDVSPLSIAGAQCALTHIVAEDRDPGTGSNVVTALLLESVGTVCMHPDDPRMGVSLAFTHRSFPEDRDRGFEAAATGLLQTQQFDQLQTNTGN